MLKYFDMKKELDVLWEKVRAFDLLAKGFQILAKLPENQGLGYKEEYEKYKRWAKNTRKSIDTLISLSIDEGIDYE